MTLGRQAPLSLNILFCKTWAIAVLDSQGCWKAGRKCLADGSCWCHRLLLSLAQVSSPTLTSSEELCLASFPQGWIPGAPEPMPLPCVRLLLLYACFAAFQLFWPLLQHRPARWVLRSLCPSISSCAHIWNTHSQLGPHIMAALVPKRLLS